LVEPETAAAVEAAVAVLVEEGALRLDVELPHLEWAQTALHGILAAEASAFHLPTLRERPGDFEPGTRAALELGCLIPAVDYLNARRMQTLVRDDFTAAFERVDAIVLAALPRPPPPIGAEVSREPRVAWNRLMTPINLAGLPAIALPCGLTADGLPIGFQVVGRPWAEARVLQIARAYERATDHHLRRPPLAA
jgi:aspartyl-tRNA(Asn)/glutamyl-tRNA(Gln) amidotransferase subunit A